MFQNKTMMTAAPLSACQYYGKTPLLFSVKPANIAGTTNEFSNKAAAFTFKGAAC